MRESSKDEREGYPEHERELCMRELSMRERAKHERELGMRERAKYDR